MDCTFEAVDRTRFHEGMARLGAAVSIVTTRGPDGPAGFTASAVCSVSDTPATLLACINRSSSCFPAFDRAGFFAVNTLAPGHEALSNMFGSKTSMAERFQSGEWLTAPSGVPVLRDAVVSFECKLVTTVDHATHRILLGRVMNVRTSDQSEALVYLMRRYHHLQA